MQRINIVLHDLDYTKLWAVSEQLGLRPGTVARMYLLRALELDIELRRDVEAVEVAGKKYKQLSLFGKKRGKK